MVCSIASNIGLMSELTATVASQLTKVAQVKLRDSDYREACGSDEWRYYSHVEQLVAERICKIERGIRSAIDLGKWAVQHTQTYDISTEQYGDLNNRAFVYQTAHAVAEMTRDHFRQKGFVAFIDERDKRLSEDGADPIPVAFTPILKVGWLPDAPEA